jgi:hypothetical protein
MDILLILAVNAVSITLVVFAGILCLRQKEGWGWFLFAAILTFSGSSAIQALTPNPPASAPVASSITE